MTDRKSGKSKKKHKEQAEKINLREAADALKAAEMKIAPRRTARTVDHEAEVIYAPEPMPVPEPRPAPEPEPVKLLAPEPVPMKVAAPEPTKQPAPPSRALVTLPKTDGDDASASLQQSFDAAQKGASAVNAKLIEMAQEAMNANLEHARDLAGATNPMQALKLQMKHWQEAMASFTAQAEELRQLTAELVAATSEPIRAHLRAQAAKR